MLQKVMRQLFIRQASFIFVCSFFRLSHRATEKVRKGVLCEHAALI